MGGRQGALATCSLILSIACFVTAAAIKVLSNIWEKENAEIARKDDDNLQRERSTISSKNSSNSNVVNTGIN